MLAGAAFGAAVVQTLHAQTKPPGYTIAEVNITNPDAYRKEFLPPLEKAVADGGGKFLVRGGKTIADSGAPPAQRVAVIQFESLERAQALLDSPARKGAEAVGGKYSTFRVFAVEGVAP